MKKGEDEACVTVFTVMIRHLLRGWRSEGSFGDTVICSLRSSLSCQLTVEALQEVFAVMWDCRWALRERGAGMFWCSHLAVQKSVMFISVPTGSSVPPGEIQRTPFMPQTITQLAFRLLLAAFQSIAQAFFLTSFLPFFLLVSHLFPVILFPPFVLFRTGPFPFHPKTKTQKSLPGIPACINWQLQGITPNCKHFAEILAFYKVDMGKLFASGCQFAQPAGTGQHWKVQKIWLLANKCSGYQFAANFVCLL